MNEPPNKSGGEHLAAFNEMLASFNKESERGSVLVAISYLEGQLEDIIKAFIVDGSDTARLFGGTNPLSSLSAKTTVAHALGLISDTERNEIERLRSIRNKFAHNHRISFADPSVKDKCSNLKLAAKSYGTVTVDARGEFSTAAVALILNLTNRAHYVGQKPLKFENWRY